MSSNVIIEVKKLSAGYGEKTVLENIDFHVTQGEVFVILGGSGCGKSTLLRQIIGLESPFSGHVLIKGMDITSCGEAEFHAFLKTIGVLFQSSGLLGSMNLFDNIALPILEYTSLSKKAVEKIVRLKLKQVDLEGFENHLPSQLSGGMKKRAGLARALALSPDILFLDEPSAGLDPITTAEIDELILRINRSVGTTIVIVTHELDSIFRIAQRVIMLDKETRGIIAQGKPAVLKETHENPMVRRFFNSGIQI
ncbi:MAG: ATP-binding cassette domain-containing protein [Proteobacteria bacterium]|nr:ATP-binding cassette domain-containing protein [Pseudomonadota bacterium]MBU4471553.1 ATP-binding cassette domain-containing protein [Pseudomonadota bacterium]MCG2752559.1 ATP-binding cassette domain-containing protein [Desulfobacteraceae bacterium]